VRGEGETVEVAYHGKVVARLVPVRERELAGRIGRGLADASAAEVARTWPPGVSAVDAVREQRRPVMASTRASGWGKSCRPTPATPLFAPGWKRRSPAGGARGSVDRAARGSRCGWSAVRRGRRRRTRRGVPALRPRHAGFAVDAGLGADPARVAARLGLRGAGAVDVATARRLGLALVTVDDELAARPRGLVPVVQP